MKEKAFIFFICLIFSNTRTQSQTYSTLPNVIPPSPTAVQFQKYGDYPVSHFTGVPQISIPLYTIKEGEIELPITIDYHASGTKVNEVRGLLGQGWTLNVGGQISRTINDEPDGLTTFKIPNILMESINCHDYNYRVNELIPLTKYYDTEYDTYSYNFAGKTGKFIVQNGTPFLFPYKPLNIGVGSQDINVVDERGIKYTFGDNGGPASIATEYVTYHFNGVDYSPTTTWHLTNISSSKSSLRGINLTYNTFRDYNYDGYSHQHIFDDGWTDPGCVNHQSVDPNENGDRCPDCITAGQALEFGNQNWGRLPLQYAPNIVYRTVYTSEITFSGGRIVFELNPTSKVLSEMRLYNQLGALVKKITFDVVPFSGSSSLGTYVRYKLVSLHERDIQDNSKVSSYFFNYIGENWPISSLDSYSYSSDYWGYYNGRGNTTGLPKYIGGYLTRVGGSQTFNRSLGNADKITDENYSKQYVLNKITYPTGGYTVFDYESNRYGSEVQPHTGGLRIKTISSFSGDTKIKEKKFTYGTGFIDIVPEPNMYLHTQFGIMFQGNWGPGLRFRRNYYSETPQIDLSPKGSSSVYPFVTETEVGLESGPITTTYHYDNGAAFDYKALDYPNTYDLALFPTPRRFTTNGKPWNFGNLIDKTTNGVAEHYEYEEVIRGTARDFKIEPYVFPTLAYGQRPICFPDLPGHQSSSYFMTNFYTNTTECYFNYADHYYISGEKRLSSVTKSYNGIVGAISTTTEYSYNNSTHNQPTQIVTKNSKGEILNTDIKYPHDFVSPNGTPNVYNAMVEEHMWDYPVEQISTKGTTNTFLQSTRTNYDFWFNHWGNNDPSKLIVPRSIEAKKAPGTNYEPRLQYLSYNNEGNLLSVKKEDDIIKSYQWGYNNSYPLAEAINAASNEIFFDGFEQRNGWDGNLTAYSTTKVHSGKVSGYINNSNNNNTELTSHSSKWLKINLTGTKRFHYSGWIYTEGPSVDLFLFMKEDVNQPIYFNQVDYVSASKPNKWVYIEKDVDVPNNIHYLSLRIDNNGYGRAWFDDLRLHPSASQMTTYTYDPLIGMTSQSNVNSIPSFFQYDAVGRLSNVRDMDNNIIKKFSQTYFNAATASASAPNWQNTTGYCELCQQNSNFVTGVYKQQQIDANPSSLTYNQMRWINTSNVSCNSTLPEWVPTGNYSCQQTSNQNTGNQLREEIMVNPCKLGFNQAIRWVNLGLNASSCPRPPYYISDEVNTSFTRTNCAPDYTGTAVPIFIPAGTFTHPNSVEEANNLALAEAYRKANEEGNCTPVPFDLSVFNSSNDNFVVELIDPITNSTAYTIQATSAYTKLVTILPGTYDINIYISGGSPSNYYFDAACDYHTSGPSALIYAVPIGSACNNISIGN